MHEGKCGWTPQESPSANRDRDSSSQPGGKNRGLIDPFRSSQSGLSRKLASLEAHLGKPLFLRTGRGMDLTEAGRKLAEAALPAYTAIDDMLVQLRDREGQPANIPAPLLRDYGLVKVPLQAPGLQRLVVAIVRHDIAAGSLARQLLNMAKAISTMA
ncbi:LysR family transcriptional regulator [Castellaniella defragrans]|uniref:LysR family transcriptional regulator n=1 Tax=Castellaniella defragrans TaxID=75697 RepID=UPI0030B867B2